MNRFVRWLLLAAVTILAAAGCGGHGEADVRRSAAVAQAPLGTECSVPSEGGWCWQLPNPLPRYVNDVFFIDALRGWAAGEGGRIHATTDGGVNWQRQAVPTTELVGFVRFTDASLGWALTSTHPTLLRTVDGGQTWQLAATVPMERVSDFRVAGTTLVVSGNPSGWIYANIVSTDGGQTWHSPQVLFGSHLQLSRQGSLWGAIDGGVWVSRDAGATTTLALPCGGGCGLRGFHATDDEHVVVLSYQENSSIGLTRHISRDAGRTWSHEPLTGPDLGAGTTFEPGAFFGAAAWGTTRRSIALPGGGSGSVLAAAWHSNDMGATWVRVPLPEGVTVISFLDATTAWATTATGGAMLTSDAGATWRVLPLGGESLSSLKVFTRHVGGALVAAFGRYSTDRWYVSADAGASWSALPGARSDRDSEASYFRPVFLDAQRGFVLAYNGTLRRTDDGGRSWQDQVLPGNPFYAMGLTFSSPQTGWVSAGGRLYRSTDSGASWQALALPDAISEVRSIQFLDDRRGWLIGMHCSGEGVISCDSTLYGTLDGGQTWTPRIGGAQMDPMWAFADENVGIHLAWDDVIYRTADGGRSWAPVASRPDGPYSGAHAIYFQDALRGWILPRNRPGRLVRTVDGGLTWTEVPIPLAASNPSAMHFVDAQTGWIVGDRAIARTDDGGATWRMQSADVGAGLSGVFALDKLHAWVVGTAGAVLATQTGGE